MLEGLLIKSEISWFKKYASCDSVLSTKGNELIYGSVPMYTQLFFLWAMHFGKRALKTEYITIVFSFLLGQF